MSAKLPRSGQDTFTVRYVHGHSDSTVKNTNLIINLFQFNHLATENNNGLLT